MNLKKNFFLLLVLTFQFLVRIDCNVAESTESIEENHSISIDVSLEDKINVKRAVSESIKGTVELYLEYERLLREDNFNSIIKKKLAINNFNKLKKKLLNYVDEDPKNKFILSKIVKQVVAQLAKKLNRNEKETNSSGMVNSITGFWG